MNDMPKTEIKLYDWLVHINDSLVLTEIYVVNKTLAPKQA
jgi:hypothetical protein